MQKIVKNLQGRYVSSLMLFQRFWRVQIRDRSVIEIGTDALFKTVKYASVVKKAPPQLSKN